MYSTPYVLMSLKEVETHQKYSVFFVSFKLCLCHENENLIVNDYKSLLRRVLSFKSNSIAHTLLRNFLTCRNCSPPKLYWEHTSTQREDLFNNLALCIFEFRFFHNIFRYFYIHLVLPVDNLQEASNVQSRIYPSSILGNYLRQNSSIFVKQLWHCNFFGSPYVLKTMNNIDFF